MSIFYPSIILGGGISTVYTSGNITGSGEETNPVTLKQDIFLTSVTASSLSASEVIIDDVGSIYKSSTKFVIEAVDSLQISGSTELSGNIAILGANVNLNQKVVVNSPSPTVVEACQISTRAARYTTLIETTTGTYHVQSMDILMANNGSSVLITPYAVTTTGNGYLASFDAQINGGNIELLVTKLTSEDITVTMTKTYLY